MNKCYQYEVINTDEKFSISQNATPQHRNQSKPPILKNQFLEINYPVYLVSPTPEKSQSSEEAQKENLMCEEEPQNVEGVLNFSGEKDSVYTLGHDSISESEKGKSIKMAIKEWMQK